MTDRSAGQQWELAHPFARTSIRAGWQHKTLRSYRKADRQQNAERAAQDREREDRRAGLTGKRYTAAGPHRPHLRRT